MLLIALCVLVIVALLCVVVCAICIKRKSDQRLEKALNEIRQHRKQPSHVHVHAKRHSRTHTHTQLQCSEHGREREPDLPEIGDDVHSVFSIEPPQMSPQHLLNIDHGLHRSSNRHNSGHNNNDEDDDVASVKVQRNALMAVTMQQKMNGRNIPSSSSSASSSSSSLTSQSSLSWTYNHGKKQNVFQMAAAAPASRSRISASDVVMEELRMSSARVAKHSLSHSNSVFIERERGDDRSGHAHGHGMFAVQNLASAYHQIPLKNAASDPACTTAEDEDDDEEEKKEDMRSIRNRRKSQIRKYRQNQAIATHQHRRLYRGQSTAVNMAGGRRMAIMTHAQPVRLKQNFASQPNLHRIAKRKNVSSSAASASLSVQYGRRRPLQSPNNVQLKLKNVNELSLDPPIPNPQPLPVLNRSWRSHSESSLSSEPMQSDTPTPTTAVCNGEGNGGRKDGGGGGGDDVRSQNSDANSNLMMGQLSISTMKTVDEHLQYKARVMMDIPPPPPLPIRDDDDVKERVNGDEDDDANTVVIVADNDNVLDDECSSKFDDASSTLAVSNQSNYEFASFRSNPIHL